MKPNAFHASGFQAPRLMEDPFITKDEVARRLKKSTRTIEYWQRRGILPFFKTGHSVLFKWSEVETHLRRNFHVCRLPRTRLHAKHKRKSK